MTKKRSSEIFTLKMDIFLEIGPRKNFLVPPKFGARSPPMHMTSAYVNPHSVRILSSFRLTCLCYPFEISLQVFIQLLPFPELLEVPPRFCLLPLLRKLPESEAKLKRCSIFQNSITAMLQSTHQVSVLYNV